MKKPLITSNDDLNERKLNNESKKLQCSLTTIQYKLYSCFRTDIISISLWEISLKKISLKSINYFRSHTIGLNVSRDLIFHLYWGMSKWHYKIFKFCVLRKYLKDNKHFDFENMLGYLSVDIICSSKLTVFSIYLCSRTNIGAYFHTKWKLFII